MLLLLLASPAGAAPGGGPRIDDTVCARLPRAAPLTGSQYLAVPPRQRAKFSPVADVRMLFDRRDTDKPSVVKKSLAEENAVLFSLGTRDPFEIADGLWQPLRSGSGSDRKGGRKDDCDGTLIAVGYDDAQYGGALEVMRECGAGPTFFWMRYDDFEQYCGCAVEAIGRPRSAGAASELAGSVRFEDASGAEMRARRRAATHELERSYPSGTRFRVIVTSRGPAYLYIFTSDPTGKIYPLFPGERESPHLAYRQSEVALPNERDHLELDNRAGTDSFAALYSPRKLDFAGLAQKMEKATGSLATRVKAALGRDLVPDADLEYSSREQISFVARSSGRFVVPLVVEIRHTK